MMSLCLAGNSLTCSCGSSERWQCVMVRARPSMLSGLAHVNRKILLSYLAGRLVQLDAVADSVEDWVNRLQAYERFRTHHPSVAVKRSRLTVASGCSCVRCWASLHVELQAAELTAAAAAKCPKCSVDSTLSGWLIHLQSQFQADWRGEISIINQNQSVNVRLKHLTVICGSTDTCEDDVDDERFSSNFSSFAISASSVAISLR